MGGGGYDGDGGWEVEGMIEMEGAWGWRVEVDG